MAAVQRITGADGIVLFNHFDASATVHPLPASRRDRNRAAHNRRRAGSAGVGLRRCTSAPAVRADDIRAAMEAANAKWLAAFNTPDPSAFPALYTADAVVLFQGTPPVRGPEAIGQFWGSRIKLGLKDHGFEILEAWADGKYAYQWARASVVLVKETGESRTFIGNTLRIFEKQTDGTWKTKVHM